MTDQAVSEKILAFLRKNPGSKATRISIALNLDKAEVNKLLYGSLRSQCRQDTAYNWYLKDDFQSSTTTITDQIVNTPLARLCNYYTSCISEDSGAKVKVFAKSKYGLDYKELKSLPSSDNVSNVFESPEVQVFLNELRRDKSQSLYFGYPTLLSRARSSKSDWEGYFVSPVFLFPIKAQKGSGALDLNFPSINREVMERFTNAKGEELMRELVSLEEELGISGEKEQPELDELAQRLKNLRPEWRWTEKIDPYNLITSPPIQKCFTEGILNRAVIVKIQEAPNNFTQGLEYELSQLSRLSENDYKGTALGQWIHRSIENRNEKNLESLLEVFPMNLEQRQAVENALVNNLTVITGPPGTGKSQVVANLLINAAWQKKRVLFASKNNKAVDVVESRINNIGTRPTLLRFGGRGDYQDQLVTHLSSLLSTTINPEDEQEFSYRKREFNDIHAELLNIDSQINDFISLRNTVDRLDREIEDVRADFTESYLTLIKQGYFNKFSEDIDKYISDSKYIFKTKRLLFSRISQLLFGRQKLKRLAFDTTRLNEVFTKMKIEIPQTQLTNIHQPEWHIFIDQLQHRWNQLQRINKYFLALDQLQNSESLEALTKQRLDLLRRMSDKSDALWKLWLKLQISRLSPNDRSLLSQYRSTLQMVSSQNPTKSVWRSYYDQSQRISHILSLWAVTSLSAKGRMPLDKDVFDIVVFDELSQCDIASALPLLYRAKQVVIIGDPKQLSHISSISKKQDERLLEKYNLLKTHSDWAYSYNSLFDLAVGLSQGTGIVDLRDHYRSHADIIGFSNKFFYKGRLRIATRYDSLKKPKNEEAGIRWINVEGRAIKPSSGSGSENEQEAIAVIAELQRLYNQGYKGTIGAISPFRAQANLIRKLTNENSELSTWLLTCEFISETVHKFQGDERDIIIFSPVISSNMPKGSVLFLQKTGNLFNVAITRARAILIVVGNFKAVLHSEVPYMEKFAKHISEIRKQETKKLVEKFNYGSDYPTVKNPERVSDWERLFYKALHGAGINSIPQYQEEMYALDFAVFDGERKLNIEIDGEHYHRDWTGELCYRDQIRNQRMFELGWDVMRFWVYEVRDDLENCLRKVSEWKNKEK